MTARLMARIKAECKSLSLFGHYAWWHFCKRRGLLATGETPMAKRIAYLWCVCHDIPARHLVRWRKLTEGGEDGGTIWGAY